MNEPPPNESQSKGPIKGTSKPIQSSSPIANQALKQLNAQASHSAQTKSYSQAVSTVPKEAQATKFINLTANPGKLAGFTFTGTTQKGQQGSGGLGNPVPTQSNKQTILQPGFALKKDLHGPIKQAYSNPDSFDPLSPPEFFNGEKYTSKHIDFALYKIYQDIQNLCTFDDFAELFFDELYGNLSDDEADLVVGGQYNTGRGAYSKQFCTYRLVTDSRTQNFEILNALLARLLKGIRVMIGNKNVLVPASLAPMSSFYGKKIIRLSQYKEECFTEGFAKHIFQNVVTKLKGFENSSIEKIFCLWNQKYKYRQRRRRDTGAIYILLNGAEQMNQLSEKYANADIGDGQILNMTLMNFTYNRQLLVEYFSMLNWENDLPTKTCMPPPQPELPPPQPELPQTTLEEVQQTILAEPEDRNKKSTNHTNSSEYYDTANDDSGSNHSQSNEVLGQNNTTLENVLFTQVTPIKEKWGDIVDLAEQQLQSKLVRNSTADIRQTIKNPQKQFDIVDRLSEHRKFSKTQNNDKINLLRQQNVNSSPPDYDNADEPPLNMDHDLDSNN